MKNALDIVNKSDATVLTILCKTRDEKTGKLSAADMFDFLWLYSVGKRFPQMLRRTSAGSKTKRGRYESKFLHWN